jgi:hypothetical protein
MNGKGRRAGHTDGLIPFPVSLLSREENHVPHTPAQASTQALILAEHAAEIKRLGKRMLLRRSVLGLLKRGLISLAEAKLRFPEVFSEDGDES